MRKPAPWFSRPSGIRVDNQTRSLYSKQLQPLQLDHRYDAWLSFDKPMRWREDGQVVPFPGQPASTLDLEADVLIFGSAMTTSVESADWLDQAGGAPDGYMNYRDDALKMTFSFPDDTQNLGLVTGLEEATLALTTTDMTGMRTDANPATVPDWENGIWKRYECTSGNEGDIGGTDTTISFQVTDQAVPPPFLLEPGITSAWYDPSHSGEGFLLEMLANNVAVMYWFTYDANGAQDWYIAAGEVRGNRIVFPNLLRVSGGEFGPGFDPAKVTEEVVGSASFVWTGCDQGDMSYRIGTQHGRMQLSRLTRLMGIDCGNPQLPPVSPKVPAERFLVRPDPQRRRLQRRGPGGRPGGRLLVQLRPGRQAPLVFRPGRDARRQAGFRRHADLKRRHIRAGF